MMASCCVERAERRTGKRQNACDAGVSDELIRLAISREVGFVQHDLKQQNNQSKHENQQLAIASEPVCVQTVLEVRCRRQPARQGCVAGTNLVGWVGADTRAQPGALSIQNSSEDAVVAPGVVSGDSNCSNVDAVKTFCLQCCTTRKSHFLSAFAR